MKKRRGDDEPTIGRAMKRGIKVEFSEAVPATASLRRPSSSAITIDLAAAELRAAFMKYVASLPIPKPDAVILTYTPRGVILSHVHDKR